MPKLGDLLDRQVRRELVDTIGEPTMTYPKVEFVRWMDRKSQVIAAEAIRRFPDQPDAQEKWFQDEILTLGKDIRLWKQHARRLHQMRSI